MKRRARFLLAPAFAARSAVGRPVRTTAGLALAAMSGTRSTREYRAKDASKYYSKFDVAVQVKID